MIETTEPQNNGKSCEWHKGDEPINQDETLGCPECYRMIRDEQCKKCNAFFIVWYGGFDDITAGGAITSRGDFCCSYCYGYIEEEIRRQEDEEVWYDDMFDIYYP